MQASNITNPAWSWGIPLIGLLVLILSQVIPTLPGITLFLCVCLIGAVVCAVHHAEVIAHKVGEPFGTLVLALAVTTIEVGLIVSMMLSNTPEQAMTLPRDTIFAAIMIILNGMIGINLLIGGLKHHRQPFHVPGMTEAISTITVIVVLALVLPNYVGQENNGQYSQQQLGFVAVAIVALFAAFTLFQTMGHRDYFLPVVIEGQMQLVAQIEKPSRSVTLFSLGFLVISLLVVVLCAKSISPAIEGLLGRGGAPAATVGIIIAAIALMPEFGASLRNSLANRMQASLNLAIGSAIASIGLTIPVVALLAMLFGWPLELGLSGISTTMLVMSLFVVALTLRTGNTNAQAGIMHLVIFATYLFFSFVP